MSTSSQHFRWTMAVATFVGLFCGLALATPGQTAQRRDFLVGPVTLGPGDTLIVAVANPNVAPSCREAAFVRFVEHVLDGSEASASDGPGVVLSQVAKAELGAARLAPGQSAKIRVSAGRDSRTTTVQVHVETERLVLGVAPCINLGGTVVRQDSSAQAVSHAQFADDCAPRRRREEAAM